MKNHRSRGFGIATLLLALLFFAGCAGQDRKLRHLELAERYFKAGEYEKAKIEYLNVLALDFNNALAESQLGIIWFEQGAPLRAYPYLAKARELTPDNLQARIRLAMV